MKTRTIMLASLLMLASGCASNMMVDSAEQELVAPAADTAQIVFLRSSILGSAIQAVVYDATDGGAEFIGILSNGKKLAHTVQPGQHVFMVVSEAADFMEAELLGGKTYYAMITPRMGAWRARFSMYPVRNGQPGEFQYDSDQFQGWLKKSQLSENTAASQTWASENESSVAKKRSDYATVWKSKSPTELAERTLNPDDGV